MTTVSTVVVGTKFRGTAAIETVAKLCRGDVLRLEREPDNKHDRNAVAVYFAGQMLGYVPRQANPRVAPAIDRGEQLEAIVETPATIDRGQVRVEPKIVVRPVLR